jgi:two-component system, NarL family, response regulator DesR
MRARTRSGLQYAADSSRSWSFPDPERADAIREVNAGRRVIDSGLAAAAAIADGVSPLTEREHDVLAAATIARDKGWL